MKTHGFKIKIKIKISIKIGSMLVKSKDIGGLNRNNLERAQYPQFG